MVLSSLTVFAFSAGMITFFAPCAYPLLPSYVAYYIGTQNREGATGRDIGRGVLIGIVVSLGFLFVFGLLTGIVVAMGAQTLENISFLELVVGLILIGLGLFMTTGRSLPTPHIKLPERRRSVFGFFGFGVIYAAAAAGCTAPLFIAVALRALSSGPISSLTIFVSYAAGMSVLMITVTVISALGKEFLLRKVTRHMGLINRAAGVLLIVAGIVQIYYFLFVFNGLEMLT